MAAKKSIHDLPPCPDPEKYILVKTKEGVFWRRKRGTVKPATLNETFAQNVTNSRIASPAAKRIIAKLHPFLYELDTGRLTARLAGRLIKTINQKGHADFSLLKGFEFQHPPLRNLLFTDVDVVVKENNITLSIPIYPGVIARRNDLVKDFYFEAILVYGDMTTDHGLRIDSTISKLYSFDDEGQYMCVMSLDLPEGSWMAIVKAICQEEDRPSAHPRHFGMKVVGVGDQLIRHKKSPSSH